MTGTRKAGTCSLGPTLARLVDDLHLPDGALAADLGCGDGQRGARMMAQLGLSVVACELDASKAELASPFGNIDVCDVREWQPPRALDLILCAELLEHLPPRDQAGLLLKQRGWLSSGGHLVLSTPQRNSPVALAERAYTRLRSQGSYNWWDPTHVSVLSRKKLERLFMESGFTIRRRIGLHLIPERLPVSSLHWTVHEGYLSGFGFDLVYVLK